MFGNKALYLLVPDFKKVLFSHLVSKEKYCKEKKIKFILVLKLHPIHTKIIFGQ